MIDDFAEVFAFGLGAIEVLAVGFVGFGLGFPVFDDFVEFFGLREELGGFSRGFCDSVVHFVEFKASVAADYVEFGDAFGCGGEVFFEFLASFLGGFVGLGVLLRAVLHVVGAFGFGEEFDFGGIVFFSKGFEFLADVEAGFLAGCQAFLEDVDVVGELLDAVFEEHGSVDLVLVSCRNGLDVLFEGEGCGWAMGWVFVFFGDGVGAIRASFERASGAMKSSFAVAMGASMGQEDVAGSLFFFVSGFGDTDAFFFVFHGFSLWVGMGILLTLRFANAGAQNSLSTAPLTPQAILGVGGAGNFDLRNPFSG